MSIKTYLRQYLKNFLNIKQVVQEELGVSLSSSEQFISDYKAKEELEAFNLDSWVFASAGLIGEAVGSQLEVFLKSKKDDKEIYEGEILNLMNTPNPYMSKFEFYEMITLHLVLSGNSFVYMERGKNGEGRPTMLIPLLPHQMTIVSDPKKYVKAYKYSNGGSDEIFQPSQIIHIKQTNPLSHFQGTGCVRPIAFPIDIDKYSDIYNLGFFKRGAIPNGALYTDSGEITEDQATRISESWNNKYQGSEKSHKTAVLTNGLKYQNITPSHNDMSFNGIQSANKDKILAALRVHRVLVSQTEGSSLAEAKVAEYIFSKYNVDAKMRRIVDAFSFKLMPAFNIDVNKFSLTYKSPIKDDEDSEFDKTIRSINAFKTINEVRIENGFDPVDGGDVIYQQMSQVPLGEEAPLPENNQEIIPIEGQPTEEEKSMKIDVKKKMIILEKFLKKHNLYEKRFITKLQRNFKIQERVVIQNFLTSQRSVKKDLTDQIFDEKRWIKEFSRNFKPLVLEIIVDYAKQANEEYKLDTEITPQNPNINKFLNASTIQFSTEVNKTTEREIRNQIQTGFDLGESTPQISDRIKHVFDVASKSRSTLIARTETTKDANGGALITFKESGVVKEKEWLGTNDLNTRDAHYTFNVKKAKLEDPFIVGGEELQMPGDPSGSPENVCNCRCVVVPVIE